MSRQTAGKRYENELCNALYEATGDEVSVYPCGYSGNHAVPSPDILLTANGVNHAMEVKNSAIDVGERTTILNESQNDDISQLCQCSNEHTRVYVGLKLTRRQLAFVKVGWTDDVSEATQSIVNRLPDAFDANHTSAGNVTVRKPETDQWPSQTKGKDDVAVICERIGLNYELDEDG